MNRITPTLALTAAALVSLAAIRASAQTLIDVDFNNVSQGTPTQSGAAVLGASGDLWNGINVIQGGQSTGSYPGLFDATGATSPVGLAFQVTEGAGGNSGTNADPGTSALMQDYIYSYEPDGAAPKLTLSGLSGYSGDAFTLVIYAAGDPGQGGTYTLSEDGVTGQTLSTSSADQMISNGEGDAYQVFSGTVSGGDITLTGAYNGDVFSAVDGVQLAITPAPEPASWALVVIGVGALVARRPRRPAAGADVVI